MKIQLKDVLFNEPFWHTEEYAKANMTHYCFKITKSYNGERFVDYTSSMGSLWGGKSDNEVWVNRDESKKTVVLSDPMTLHCLESAVDTFVVQGRYSENILHMSMNDGDNDESLYIVLSAEDEDKLRQYLLERAGLVAITLEENKDRIVMRNNHEGFVEEIVGLNAQLKKVSESAAPVKAKSRVVEINWGEETDEEFAERHRVKAVDVPVGMVFYTNYNDFNLDNEGTSMTMRENLKYLHNGYGHESETPLSSEFVYVSHPEKCNVEIQTPVRTEKEIRMEILKLTLELLSVTSGMSKEEIVDHCLNRARKDEQIRQMDLSTKNDF